ncbi:MAG: alpha/beta fold hydrolase, partial [Planctomycetota bacterium]
MNCLPWQPTEFRPPVWLRSGLLQTMVAMRIAAPLPRLRLETWPTPDGDELRVHFGDAPSPASPRVLLLHGLEGSRHSPYVVATAHQATAAGLGLVVLEFRSCGGVLNRARRTYHSGETSDLAFVVARLTARFPQAPLLPLGFSLGANVLLKWLGENGDGIPANVLAAAAISAPFDLAVCGRQCDRRFGGAIARHFLRTLIPKAVAKERQFPGLCDVAAVRRCRTFAAFDDLVTAPLHGFRDANEYYRTQSCGPLLPAIRRPTLLIAAADDPLSTPDVLPHAAVAGSSFLRAQFPAHGGHVAFVSGGWPW